MALYLEKDPVWTRHWIGVKWLKEIFMKQAGN